MDELQSRKLGLHGAHQSFTKWWASEFSDMEGFPLLTSKHFLIAFEMNYAILCLEEWITLGYSGTPMCHGGRYWTLYNTGRFALWGRPGSVLHGPLVQLALTYWTPNAYTSIAMPGLREKHPKDSLLIINSSINTEEYLNWSGKGEGDIKKWNNNKYYERNYKTQWETLAGQGSDPWVIPGWCIPG